MDETLCESLNLCRPCVNEIICESLSWSEYQTFCWNCISDIRANNRVSTAREALLQEMDLQVSTCIHMCIRICIHVYICKYIHICICIYVYVYVYVFVYMYMYMYMYMYI